MSNALIAPVQSSTTSYAGLSLVEDAVQLSDGIRNHSWVDGTLGAIGGGLDALGMVVDPIGSLASMGAAWLMEHVKPLREALDLLAGNPDEVSAHSATWANIAKCMDQAHQEYAASLRQVTAAWQGLSAQAYHEHADTQLAVLSGISTAAQGISYAVQGAGMLVGMVRGFVRDLIAQFVATLAVRLPEWLAEEGVTLGLATPVVVTQVVTLVAEWVSKIQRFVRALLNSMRRLTPMLHRLGEIFTELKALLSKLARSNPLTRRAAGGAGADAAAGGARAEQGIYHNAALRDGPSFDEEYSSILASKGLDRAEHDGLRLSAADHLTEPQAKEVIDVRSEMTADPGTVMTKVLHPNAADAYLDNVTKLGTRDFNADEVGGFVARGKDVADFQTPKELRDNLALDDRGAGWTPITEDADHAYHLRYLQPDNPNSPIAFGGRTDAVAERMKDLSGNSGNPIRQDDPFLGTGYTAKGGVPEFMARELKFDRRAEIWQMNKDGSERLVGIFDSGTRRWTRVGS